MNRTAIKFLSATALTAVAAFAQTAAAPAPVVDSGDTAWLLMSSALVMLMTIPGLALFYGGLVKRKNVLSVLMQCFVALALISVIWVVAGYSLAFGPGKGALAPYIGSLDWAMLKGMFTDGQGGAFALSPYFISHSQPDGAGGTIGTLPHLVFMVFQMMFAVITPALIIGAFAERMKFSAYLVFTALWSLLVYVPIAHWVWSGDGWLFKMGALDFAGGTVVHINAGIAALVMTMVLGKRRNLKSIPPHNLTYTMIGASLLWFGWFGFNAGSGLAADGLAASAFVMTNTAAAAAALTWGLLDRIFSGKATMLGVSTGAVAGLVAITPAAGFVGVGGALAIGLASSLICYFFVVVIKNKFGYDDALDAFGVHGIGGLTGAILTGVFATPFIQSAYSGSMHQLKVQVIASLSTLVYSFIVTFILAKVLDKIMGLRVDETEEAMGLDITQHNERGYTVLD